MNILRKSIWTAGLVALVGLILVCAPTLALAADPDGDGLDDFIEMDQGFILLPGYDLWDAAAKEWIPGGANGLPFKGAASEECNEAVPGTNCLSPEKPDLFVIWQKGNFIDLQFCDIFAMGTKPAAEGGLGFNIWVLRENGNGGLPESQQQFTAASEQKAVKLIESPSTTFDATGKSDYAGIMDEFGGSATIFSQTIVNNIEAAAAIDPQVQSSTDRGYCPPYDADGNAVPAGANCLQCLHFQNTAIHEILHVMDTLRNDLSKVYSHHLTRGDYIMTPAIVYTEKKGMVTYYIPDEASSAAQTTWSFNPIY
jgi:hypothetical protein